MSSNLRRIGQAFNLSEDRANRPIRNEDELKKWLGQLGEPGDPDSFLTSQRDGQPYVVYYGQKTDGDSRKILAHEKNGADGSRYVLTQSRSVKLLSDAEFGKAEFVGKR